METELLTAIIYRVEINHMYMRTNVHTSILFSQLHEIDTLINPILHINN